MIVILNHKLDYLPLLKRIQLSNNDLRVLHPKMFSNLERLRALGLSGNPCIDRKFEPVTSIQEIEIELRECGYGLLERRESELEGMKTRSQEKVDDYGRKFEYLSGLLENYAQRNEENARELRELGENLKREYLK
jgi:hypothetical protein